MTATAGQVARSRGRDGRYAKRSLHATLAKHSERLAEQSGPPLFDEALAAADAQIRKQPKTGSPR